MRAARLQELEEMGVKLQATARELPSGPDRHNILREIRRFRAEIAALQSADLWPARRGLKAKGKPSRTRDLSRYRPPTSAAFAAGPLHRRAVVSGNIFNSNGIHVAVVNDGGVFDLDGQKLYDLKGINIYRLSGELVGHLNNGQGTEKRLDRSTDRLFPARGRSRQV